MELSFVMTPQGLTVMSIGPILPSSYEMELERSKRHYVLFSRQMTSEDMPSLSETYVVPGMRFVSEESPVFYRPQSTTRQARRSVTLPGRPKIRVTRHSSE